MDCALCQNLQSELERIRAQLVVLRGETDRVRGSKNRRSLRIAENAALLALEIVRDKLNRHLREHPAHLTAP